mgnify:CR=1 FL=1
MEFLTQEQFKILSNPGVESTQLLSPHNSESNRVTIMRVVVKLGASQPAYKHASSEQIWIAVSGQGTLILKGQTRRSFAAGEVVRFADGDMRGFTNSGIEPFIYLSVTSPPINFSDAYTAEK